MRNLGANGRYAAITAAFRKVLLRSGFCIGAILLTGATLFAAQNAQSNDSVIVLDRNGQAIEGVVLWSVKDHTPDIVLEQARDRAVIDQRNKRFEPFVSIVTPGTEVSFPNSDDTRHHVYSFSKSKRFELKLYEAHDASPVLFEDEGIVTLGCNIHDNMQAYLLVTDRPYLGISAKDGVVVLDAAVGAATAPLLAEAWHPLLNQDPILVDLNALRVGPSGVATIDLPMEWDDPQSARSAEALESLLKQFSRNAP